MKLLFLIKKNDYSSDVVINKSCESLSNDLEMSYIIMKFWYRFPKIGIKYISMIKKSWESVNARNLKKLTLLMREKKIN